MWRTWLVALAVVPGLGALAVGAAHVRDMRAAYARIEGRSAVVASPLGDIEYARGGSGTPVLVIHGSGGGFDNGEFLARAVLDDGRAWIAPSRFGYLRSTFRAGATFDDQARAYAFLLDHLGIGRVAVVAISHGGPSALLFAARYPERVSSLTLISAGVASSPDAAQAQANRKGDLLTAVYRYDFLYWSITHLFRQRFLSLMGADPSVIARLGPAQQRLVDEVIDGMNPVSPRAAGVAFDHRAAMPNERIASIRAPTLIVHARDDTLQLYRHAEYAQRTIPAAQLVSFDRGGHLVVVVEQATIRAAVHRHLTQHAGS